MQQLSPAYLGLSPEQLQQKSKVRLEVLPDAQALHEHFARAVADEIKANNQAGRPTRLILPVGPVAQYPLLAEICNHEQISLHNVHTFNMDEYCDWQGRWLPENHPLSFRGFMHKHFFAVLDPELRNPPKQVHFPDPLNLDALSQAIRNAGGIDTCYGGIGYHGHVAFNEPPVSRWYRLSVEQFRSSLTRLVYLPPDTVVMNSIRNTGGNSTNFPPMGVTIGMADILAANRIRMYCPGGAWQRHILRIACLGEEDVDYPVSLLQSHPDYEIITDAETAAPVVPSLGA